MPATGIVGPLARSAGDLALALKATEGPTGNDAQAYRLKLPKPGFTGSKGLRIAVLPSHPATRVAHAGAELAVKRISLTVDRCWQILDVRVEQV